MRANRYGKGMSPSEHCKLVMGSSLKCGTKLVLLYLGIESMRLKKPPEMSMDTLASQVGMHRADLNNMIDELHLAGWIDPIALGRGDWCRLELHDPSSDWLSPDDKEGLKASFENLEFWGLRTPAEI